MTREEAWDSFFSGGQWDIVARAVKIMEEEFKRKFDEDNSLSKKCDCDIRLLMTQGCKCGGT